MLERFPEPGRLALITYGPCAGKMCTIVDIVDQKRVVVDGPEKLTGVRRHMMPLRRLSLTDQKTTIPRGAREKTLKKALAKENTMATWEKTSWAKKVNSKKARAAMSDFDRFKLMVARKKLAQANVSAPSPLRVPLTTARCPQATKLSPFLIKFTHDKISKCFRTGFAIDEAIRDIQAGRLAPEAFPPLEVVVQSYGLYSLSNRRLFMFRVLASLGVVDDCSIEFFQSTDKRVRRLKRDRRLRRVA